MKRTRDNEDFDENGMIREGGRVRIPMMMMDSVQRSVDTAHHRPRSAVTDANKAERQAAYDGYDSYISNAWRRDAEGSQEARSVGGTGLVDGDCESKAEEAASRPCSDNRSVNQIVRDHQANMDRIYADHDRKVSEAWRRS